MIELAVSDNVAVGDLNDQVPKNDARYHLYMYQHKRDGNITNSVCKYIYFFFLNSTSIKLNYYNI